MNYLKSFIETDNKLEILGLGEELSTRTLSWECEMALRKVWWYLYNIWIYETDEIPTALLRHLMWI